MKTRNNLVVFCDGGARGNPGPAAAACVVEDRAGKKRYLCGKYLGEATNNQAEYAAVDLALEVIKENYQDKQDVAFFLDSTLVANQLSGLYKVKNPSLRDLIFKIRQLESYLGEVYYQYVSREDNTEADGLVNRVLDKKKGFLEILSS
jgi:ribonuclease HI